MRRAWALLLLSLGGCVSISFGGQRLDHGDAVLSRQIGLGVWKLCGAYGAGFVSGECLTARPGASVALVDGRLVRLNLSQGVNHASFDHPIRTAGADGAQP